MKLLGYFVLINATTTLKQKYNNWEILRVLEVLHITFNTDTVVLPDTFILGHCAYILCNALLPVLQLYVRLTDIRIAALSDQVYDT